MTWTPGLDRPRSPERHRALTESRRGRRLCWPKTRPMNQRPLLCELHAHSTWSDGDLPISELVDRYGQSGFDVLCVTDHVGRTGEWHDPRWRVTRPEAFADYLAEIDREARRADDDYGLLVIPGLELSYDDHDPLLAAHAVAIG